MRQSGYFQLQTPDPLIPRDPEKILSGYEVHNTFVDFRGPRPMFVHHSTAPAAVFRSTRYGRVSMPSPELMPLASPHKISQSPFKWADDIPGDSINMTATAQSPQSAVTAPTVVVGSRTFGDWSPFNTVNRWTPPPPSHVSINPTPSVQYIPPPPPPEVLYHHPPPGSTSTKLKRPPPELSDVSPTSPYMTHILSSPTLYNVTASSPIGPPGTMVDWRAECVYSPATASSYSAKWSDNDNQYRTTTSASRHSFYPPRRRLFHRQGDYDRGATAAVNVLDDISSSCSPSWNGDGVRCSGIVPYSPTGGIYTLPSSPVLKKNTTEEQQQVDHRNLAWTIIWIDELAFKSDAKAKKDSLSEAYNVRVKAYKSTEKCIRAFDKRYKDKAPSYAHLNKQIIVVSEGNALELLEYLNNGMEWLAPKLIIIGPSSNQLKRRSKLISATVRDWEQLMGLIGRTIRSATTS
ncbi:hypothetical protein FOL47_010013 [Perkinsus chesapeaki]|uniref:Uncharacterized protein n=1 Tax=Perkinsus chesapeaki TaxID=330153 RepID=A0A7J6MQL2_PERCH|nr:hypothetical protein FOL47_010013 [Perkinsus chesapeaki]